MPSVQTVIPQSRPDIGSEEIEKVVEVLQSGWITQGVVTQKFEEQFASYVGAPHAVFVNSGTSALFLALKWVGVAKEEDEVIVPALTFTASASTIVHAGGTPVFADVDPDTLCLDPALVASRINPCTRAVVTVHLAGREAPRHFADLPVIEDSAHRIERSDHGGNLMCFSFYPTKNMTTGEGGMIALADEGQLEWLRRARLHGFSRDGWRRYHAESKNWEYGIDFLGWKMNGTDLAAALGLAQLAKLDKMSARRHEIVRRYNEAFGLNRKGNHLYLLVVKDPQGFLSFMNEHGVRCMRHFVPLHLQKGYERYSQVLPVTESLAERLVSLPLYATLTDEEMQRVIETVKKNPHW